MGRILILLLLIAWICFGTYQWTCVVNEDCENGFAFFNFGKNKIDRPGNGKLLNVNGPVSSFSIIADGIRVTSNENISFDINGYNPDIPPSIRNKFLKEVKNFLYANPNSRLNIIGHYRKSDNKPVGQADLGLARANALKSYLIRSKINANQINVTSLLKNNPIILDQKVMDGVSFTISKVKTTNRNTPNKSKTNNNNAIVSNQRETAQSNTFNRNNKVNTKTPDSKTAASRPEVKNNTAGSPRVNKKSVPFSQNAKTQKGNLYELTKVKFSPNSIGPDRSSFSELYTLANFLKINSNANVEIGCHVKQTSNPKSDVTLSTNRARAISTFITGKGIKQNRISFKGYGSASSKNKDKVQILFK